MPEYEEPVSEGTGTIGSYLTSQCLQDRFGFSRREVDSVLPIASSILKYREADVQPIDAITQEPRWPTECKVIQERVRHIEYSPPLPEPYYVPTGKEPRPKPINEDMGTVIYTYNPMSATNYFSRSCAGGTVVLTTPDICSTPENSNDIDFTNQSNNNNNKKSDLKFESRFESGNLGKVIKITDTYYQLHMRRDLYTQRHMQWFYFRISNTRSKIIYRLSIVNFCKEDSLYNEGLRPLLYSTKDASLHAVGWRRCGDNITYYKNDSSDEEKEKHTLTFNITFPHDQDTVYLAHCYPYTYTDLQEYLTRISSDPVKSRFTKLRLLCRTLAGNSVHYLTITAPNCNDEARKKKGIVLTARVHPGETPSSWMMKGIIDFLTGESNQARELRERFIFKLVPMLNPDGVIVGNNRCSLSGKDLNRQYRTVMRESYPSVWHTKLMIRRLMEECGISIYCDLHAHSRKHNIFIYGCESKRAGCYGKLTEQIFPLMLHKNAADKFSFENCKFHIEKGKEGTSRVVVWLMGVQNSYTMEASMGGSKLGSRSGTHFSAQDYEQIGKAFCETLLDFSDEDPTKERLRNKILQRLMKEGSSADEPTNINLTDYSSDEGDTSDSSSEEIKLATSEATILLDSETSGDYRSQYLTVPPPSPQLPKSQSSMKSRKMRKKSKIEESRSIRRKLLNRRAAMDLPATDPGSDMCCDLTDSADEYYMTVPIDNNPRRRRRRSGGSARRMPKDTSSAVEKTQCDMSKKDFDNDTLPLLRPHTLAFVEESTIEKITCTLPKRTRGTQPVRFMRHLSPILPRTQDVQIKLTSLRQIWTGDSDIDYNHQIDNNDALFNQKPMPPTIKWGVSQMALMCQKNSEALLKSCSKKLESLTSLGKLDSKKSKKSNRNSARATKSQPSEENPDEEPKNQKKKRIRFKRQKAVTSASNLPDEPTQSSTTLANETVDTLKLFGVSKLPKPPLKSKTDNKKKFKRSGIVATATIHVSKIKTKTVIDNYSDSSSSGEAPATSNRQRTIKKKKKNLSPKKRAHSASFLHSDKF